MGIKPRYFLLLLFLAVGTAYSQKYSYDFVRSIDFALEASPIINSSTFKDSKPIDPRFLKRPFLGYFLGIGASKKLSDGFTITSKLLYTEVGQSFKFQNTYLPNGRSTSATTSKNKFEFINFQIIGHFRLKNRYRIDSKQYMGLGIGILHIPSEQAKPTSIWQSEVRSRSIDRLSKDTTNIIVTTRGRDFQRMQVGVIIDYRKEINNSKKILFEYFITARLGLQPLFKSELKIIRQNFQSYPVPYTYENHLWNQGHYIGLGIRIGIKSQTSLR